MKKYRNNNNFHYLIFYFILLSLTISNNVVLSQTCDIGYNYIAGVGCRSTTGSTILSMAYCAKPGAVQAHDYMQVMSSSLTPEKTCYPGFSVVIATLISNVDPNSKTMNIFTCGHNGVADPSAMVGVDSPVGCPASFSLYPTPVTVTFSDVNRYLVQHYCGSLTGVIAVSYFVVRSVPEPIPNYCATSTFGGWTLVNYYVWEYGGTTKCPIGYEGPLPCTPVNQCATNNGGCNHNCASTLGIATCSCNAGYTLSSDGKTCVDINECTVGISGCNQVCTNTIGSFTCSCNTGYRLGTDSKTCQDINECNEGNSGCNQLCTNTAGSYYCSCGSGYTLNFDGKGCTDVNECLTSNGGCVQTCTNTIGSFSCSCGSGYTLNSDGKGCTDVNECLISNGGCAQTCTNTIGSFTCSCNNGYRLGTDSKTCQDINECNEGTSGCNQLCTNTAGSFTCSCNSGYRLGIDSKTCQDINECNEGTSGCSQTCSNTIGSFNCGCNSGYRLETDAKTCLDINECNEGSSGCSQTCTNSIGSFNCGCNSGYRLGSDAKTCQDINECNEGTSGCAQICTNSIGSFSCSCNSNYTLNANGKSCDDVNECSLGTFKCIGVSSCSNTIGGYNCNCPTGYKLNSNNIQCDDLDECNLGTSGCNQLCTNSIGSFTCSCNSGYRLNVDSKTCQDINECDEGTSGCNQLCTNTAGSFTCSCNSSYSLSSDGKTCIDINECTDSTSGCNQVCTNSIGSFACSCNNGYRLGTDSKTCQDINECIEGTSDCAQTCTNSIGSFSCSCNSNYTLNANGRSCDDVDECSLGTFKCIGISTCSNTIGGYNCNCPTGYSLNSDNIQCDDLDECNLGTSGCNQLCTNNQGGFSCGCSSGFELDENEKDCNDLDECVLNIDGCNQLCTNTVGSFACSCSPGYVLESDLKTCVDIDECDYFSNSCQGNAECENSVGSFSCNCPSGFELTSNKTACQDIDECNGSNLCDSNTTCENNSGSYSCLCLPNYSRVSPYLCEAKPIISLFYQKPIEYHTFLVQGFNFNQNSIITIENENGEIQCIYKSGNDTMIECTTNQGIEVRGNVTIESNTLISDKFEFVGAPFLISYSNNPSTSGNDQITFTGRNLPITDNIKFSINSNDCQIISVGNEQIKIKVPEGSGGLNNIKIENEFVSNTDSIYLTYANPIISSTSIVYQSGGVLTINGFNFGPSIESAEVFVEIGTHQCNDVKVLSHNQLTCNLEATNKIYSQLIDLVVDGLTVDNNYYFEYSTLENGICPNNCNSGECTSFGCICPQGLTGISCNETSIEIIPIVPKPDVPSIEIGNGNNGGDNNGFGYKITILRIEELDFNNVVINDSSISLFNAIWNSSSGGGIDNNKWSFNITLVNKSYLEATFEYFKQSKNITFASNSFIIPAESLKLSFTTKEWPFQSKLNTLRVVIQTETLILNENVKECSISNSITTTYNQHLWSTTENSESGIVARFVSIAELDEIYSIIANIEDLSNSNSNKNSIIGISVPFFSKQSVIDPDFSMLLNTNSNKETGNCKSSENKINWQLATGLSIGGAGVVCLGVASSFFIRERKKKQQLNNMLNAKISQYH